MSEMPTHDNGCQCWPHVSRRDAERAIEAVALAEYRSGGAGRAVQEGPSALRLHDGLDVERLAQAMEACGLGLYHATEPRMLLEQSLSALVAEYNRGLER